MFIQIRIIYLLYFVPRENSQSADQLTSRTWKEKESVRKHRKSSATDNVVYGLGHLEREIGVLRSQSRQSWCEKTDYFLVKQSISF